MFSLKILTKIVFCVFDRNLTLDHSTNIGSIGYFQFFITLDHSTNIGSIGYFQFFIILNVAVGGVGFFPDKFRNSPYPKPWNDKSEFTARDFWNHKSQWYPTWNPDQNDGEQAAMQVDYIRVWKLKP